MINRLPSPSPAILWSVFSVTGCSISISSFFSKHHLLLPVRTSSLAGYRGLRIGGGFPNLILDVINEAEEGNLTRATDLYQRVVDGIDIITKEGEEKPSLAREIHYINRNTSITGQRPAASVATATGSLRIQRVRATVTRILYIRLHTLRLLFET